MSPRIVPFTAAHAQTLAVQAVQSGPGGGSPMTWEHAAVLELAGPCFSLLDDKGRCLGAAGLIPQWPGRAIAWALLSPEAVRHLVRITRAASRFLAGCGYERVEATADASFPAARRWLEMLGFEQETERPMRRYAPDGRAAYLYARVSA